jgi:hemoglobin
MKLGSTLAACALGLMLVASVSAQQAPSLYKRLGGYDALAVVTDDFIGRLAGDPQLAKIFVGHSTDSLKKIRHLVVDQL